MDSWLDPKTDTPASARTLNRLSGSQLKLKMEIYNLLIFTESLKSTILKLTQNVSKNDVDVEVITSSPIVNPYYVISLNKQQREVISLFDLQI